MMDAIDQNTRQPRNLVIHQDELLVTLPATQLNALVTLLQGILAKLTSIDAKTP